MKVHKTSELYTQFLLFPAQNFEVIKSRFYQSDLVKIYSAIPWNEIIEIYDIKEEQEVASFFISTSRSFSSNVLKKLFRSDFFVFVLILVFISNS